MGDPQGYVSPTWSADVASARERLSSEGVDPDQLHYEGWHDGEEILACIEAADQLGWIFVAVISDQPAGWNTRHCLVVRARSAQS